MLYFSFRFVISVYSCDVWEQQGVAFCVHPSPVSFDTDRTVCNINHLNPLNLLHHDTFCVWDYLIRRMLF